MHVEEGWLDPWRGGEEACSGCHGVGGRAAAMEWEREGHGHSDGEEVVCGGGALSSDANEEQRRPLFYSSMRNSVCGPVARPS